MKEVRKCTETGKQRLGLCQEAIPRTSIPRLSAQGLDKAVDETYSFLNNVLRALSRDRSQEKRQGRHTSDGCHWTVVGADPSIS